MNDMAVFYALNAASGALLAVLGTVHAIQARRRVDYALALFLMAWGAQLAFMNAAGESNDLARTETMVRLGIVFLPIQALLLLYYAAQGAQEKGRFAVYDTCRILALLVALCALAGMAMLLFAPGRVDAGPLRTALFNGPHFLGISLGLLLVALDAESKPARTPDWLLVVGLALGWAASIAYPLSFRLKEWSDSPLPEILLLSLLLLAFAVPFVLALRARQGDPGSRVRHSLLAALPLLALPVLLVTRVDGNGWLFLSPGAFRLAALGVLVPALWPRLVSLPWSASSAGKKALFGLPVLAILGACAILAFMPGLDDLDLTLALILGSLGLVAIGWLGLLQMRSLLAPKATV